MAVRNPKIINYPEPNFYQDINLVSKTGCVSAGNENDWFCSPESQMGLLGCDSISTDERLGGFDPPYTIWQCNPNETVSKDYVVSKSGCTGGYSYTKSFVLAMNGKYRLLNVKDISDLKETFGPIDSDNEALSYLIAASEFYKPLEGIWPQFHFYTDFSPVFYLQEVNGTHVENVKDGYLINMFGGDNTCGCYDHSIYQIMILVTKGGEFQILNRHLAYTFYACGD